MSLLEKAIAIAAEAHRDKKDKGSQPCILHPLRVLFRVESEEERIVATREPMQNNTRVRQRLGQRGIKSETLPPLHHSSFVLHDFKRG